MSTAAVVGCGDVSGVPEFNDHRALLAAVRPDVAHVCTPHDQHAAVVVDCLKAGVA